MYACIYIYILYIYAKYEPEVSIHAEAPAKAHNLGRREIPGSCPRQATAKHLKPIIIIVLIIIILILVIGIKNKLLIIIPFLVKNTL